MANNDGNIVKRTQQYIENIGFDETLLVPMREIVGTTDNVTLNRLAVDSTGAAKVTGTVTATLTGTQDVNNKQVNGTTTDTNSGNKSAGTQRVVIATDDVNVSAIKTDLDTLAGTVSGGAVAIQSGGATGAAVPSRGLYQAGQARTSLPSAATEGNLTGVMVDKFGRLVTVHFAPRELRGSQTTTITASTTETTIVTAVASTFMDLTALTVANTSATDVRVDFRDTTAGSVIFSLYVPGGDTRGIVFSTPQPQTTVNTNWTATSSASVTDLRIFAQFVKNK